jgi:NAD(P)-dependent dehydrogenase (short-subunit alcohol dehydrogenase family)
MINLSGKVILVTGASSGIGRSCAVLCSKLGARVAIMGRDEMRLEQTLKDCDQPDRHLMISLDLIQHDKFDGAIRSLVDQLGKLNGIIHCAGISSTLPLSALNEEKFQKFFSVNVTSSILLTKAAIKNKYFSDEGGGIVFMSSVMGIVGEKGKILYSATKGALISAVRSMALELAIRKIRVNSLSPGVVKTPLVDRAFYSQSIEGFKQMEALHPLGIGLPEDVANASVFMISDASRWITGSNFVIDGGYSIK